MRLDRIKTGVGDKGETAAGSGERLPKTHPLIEALGAVDELNSVLGVLAGMVRREFRDQVRSIQNDLFDVGADLSVPVGRARRRALRIREPHTARLEHMLDRLNKRLKPMASFVLPGGCREAAACHVARAVCRRAERRVWGLRVRGRANPEVARYLNRLSDYLFVLARTLNRRKGGDSPWVPGASCTRTR